MLVQKTIEINLKHNENEIPERYYVGNQRENNIYKLTFKNSELFTADHVYYMFVENDDYKTTLPLTNNEFIISTGITFKSGVWRCQIGFIDNEEKQMICDEFQLYIEKSLISDCKSELPVDTNVLNYYEEIKKMIGENGGTGGGPGKDGKSAYEIALEHGFEGTEEEWLLSLKGEKGDVEELTNYYDKTESDSRYLQEIPSEYVTEEELKDKKYLTQIPDEYAKKTDIPTDYAKAGHTHDEYASKEHKHSEYLTEHQSLEEYAKKTDIPIDYAKENHNHSEYSLKEHTHDEYLTEHQDLSDYAKKNEIPTTLPASDVHEWAKAENKPSYTANEVGALSKDTKIPTKVSELENDSKYLNEIPSEYVTETELEKKGYLTEHQPLTDYAKKTDIPTDYAKSKHTHDEYLKEVPSEYVTEEELESKGYLTEHQSLSDYAKKSEIPTDYAKENHTHDEYASKEHTHSEYLTEHQDLSSYAKKTEVPTKTSQLTNDSNFVSKEVTDKLTEEIVNHTGNTTKHITSAERGQWNKNTTDIATLQKELEDLTSAKAEGNTLEEQLAWLEANGDPTKQYLLIDGNYYKAEYHTTEGEKVPNFTNILDGATISINKRFNSSDALKDATGYIAIDHLAVKSNDVIRVNDVNVISSSAGSNRVKYYNSSKSAITTYTGSDARADQLLKLTKENGVMSWVVGYYNTTLGNDSTNTLPTQASNIAYMRANLYISSSSITEADITDLIMTKNQEITYTTLEGETTIVWVKSGNTSSNVDYGNRISTLETTAENHEVRIKSLELGSTSSMTVYAPSPQLPADGTSNADFNASDMGCDDIYTYIDALVSKYPRYITKETLGKDASNTYDWNRYVCAKRTYDAWQKVNYSPMYAWVNGSTTIYSTSVSPRIGDTLYTTPYIGTSKGTVSAVSNANQTRTVGGVVYTRDKTKDIEPTLVYTQTAYSTYYVGAYAGHKNGVYNSSQSKIGTISTYTGSNMTDSNGVSYTRYPLGDRNENFETIQAIVLGANEHGGNVNGDPREPAIVTSRLIKDLCECVNANNPFLNLLKNDYMIVFCPIINPYGFTQSTYENANGINIDRNFDTVGWGNDTSSGSAQGSYGGSENETQYFMNTLVASKCKIALANHCLGSHLNTTTGESANAGMCHYMLGRNNSKYNNHLNSIGASMSANYNLSFTDYGQAPCESYAKTRSYIDSIGAEGGAVEMNAREGFVLAGEGTLHTARILEADYTLLLQFLHMLIECQTD